MQRAFLVLVVLISGCSVALTPAGSRVNLIGSDLVQAMPGRPMDKCKIVKHLNVSVAGISPCPMEKDAEAAIRNEAAANTQANVVILTNIKREAGHEHCALGATGIAVSCDDETLKAAGL